MSRSRYCPPRVRQWPALGSRKWLLSRKNSSASSNTPLPIASASRIGARQPSSLISRPPTIGATTMAYSMPIMVSASAGPAWAFHTSRTTVRASTSAAQAPRPCTTRAAINCWMSLTSSIDKVASTYSSSPPISTGRRPIRSDSGPNSSCPRPKAATNADSAINAEPGGANRACSIRPKPGMINWVETSPSAVKATSKNNKLRDGAGAFDMGIIRGWFYLYFDHNMREKLCP
ncbi:hypothetical protein EMIT0357P_220015 [Pseudomonas marginalis]